MNKLYYTLTVPARADFPDLTGGTLTFKKVEDGEKAERAGGDVLE